MYMLFPCENKTCTRLPCIFLISSISLYPITKLVRFFFSFLEFILVMLFISYLFLTYLLVVFNNYNPPPKFDKNKIRKLPNPKFFQFVPGTDSNCRFRFCGVNSILIHNIKT